MSIAADRSLSWYESVAPETPSRIRYAPVSRQMKERATPEFPNITPEFSPTFVSRGDHGRFGRTKEYSVFLIFFA